MAPRVLTDEARAENALTLATAAGLTLEEADHAFEKQVLISAADGDVAGMDLAYDVHALLVRTFTDVTCRDALLVPDLEIIVGSAVPRSAAPRIYVEIGVEGVTVRRTPASPRAAVTVPRIFLALAACYVAAASVHALLPDALPDAALTPFLIRFAALGVEPAALTVPLDLGTTYLAGAGAIGNGFLWALRHLPVSGKLIIADDDVVKAGNLNRQLFFDVTDVNLPKALRLAARAQSALPQLTLQGHRTRLQQLPMRTDGPWLSRLIVAVDSRRARRELQNECPGEVFDASTTGIHEVVVHYHKQPTPAACLSCIYHADQAEQTLEQHIAVHLGVEVTDVRESRVSAHAAERIAACHPQLAAAEVVGTAYDTLFKQLCAAGALHAAQGERVIAPFAFVSALAGTLLALELVRRLSSTSSPTDNYWSVSAWRPPLASRRRSRPTEARCKFCGDDVMQQLNNTLWGPIRSAHCGLSTLA